ncbi:hypothetical protein Ga0451573_003027 [Peptococcaceae bacterium DYL19]|nr:hypothetical protein [Phosphitispora fastidiosa]
MKIRQASAENFIGGVIIMSVDIKKNLNIEITYCVE